jgi:hypothetical protein
MKKLYLISIIEKYYLNGLCERVQINIKNKTACIRFITAQKNIVGTIEAPNIILEDCEMGVYNTSQLLKLLNITDSFLTLQVEKKGKISNKLFIADNEYNLEYSLADIMLTPILPKIEEPTYELEADINIEFINKFIKAKKALDTDIFIIDSGIDTDSNNIISFLLGGTDNYTNKINFSIKATKSGIPGVPIKFPINEFKEILDNNKDLTFGKIYISEQGLMKVEFVGKENEKSTYFLVGKE